jgi:pimeloyl-ACP methyl ester carboxylesterase
MLNHHRPQFNFNCRGPSMDNTFAANTPTAPSLGMFGMEPFRDVAECASMRMMDKQALPEGDGHPVIIFPGLAADRRSLVPLRNCCEELGYAVYDWQQGFNTGPQGDVDAWLENLGEHVRGVATLHGRRVSLIGWSLGGIYAREIAKILAPLVRQVVTLGTPFVGNGRDRLYRVVNGSSSVVDDDKLATRLRTTPPVPTTSIYNRGDGVVAWQTCLLDGSFEAGNVEVDGSHMGMPWNAHVLRIVADRLSRPEGAWQRHARAAGQA